MKQISFDISSAMLTEGVGKALRPNKDGIYERVALLVLGKVSRNNKEYDVESMVQQITNPASVFYRKLKGGGLEGEWCHPLVFREEELARIATIDRTKVSHTIHRVYTGETTEKGHTIVYGDIEPSGPFGQYLHESFQNPKKNTAFSLRSLVSKIGQVGPVIKQYVNALITIDAVDVGGYPEAAKVYIQGLESLATGFDKIINPSDCMSELKTVLGAESIDDQQLLDLLETNSVSIRSTVHGIYDSNTGSIITDNGNKSIFHAAFGD